MKIAVFGAGAMGSLYGGWLSKTEDVVLVDVSEELVSHINKNGIVGIEQDGNEKHYDVKAVVTGTNEGIQDLIIVFVKGMYTEDVMSQNKSMIGENTIVLTLQNGAGNNRDIEKYVRIDNVLVGTTLHNSVVKGQGVFYHSGSGSTNIGPEVQTPENMQKAKLVANILQNCGFEVNVLDNVQEVIWKKLFVNCGVNGLSMIVEQNIGEVWKNKFLWDLCKHIVDECVLVAEADGTYVDRREALEITKKACKSDATGFASTYQDRIHCRKTEIDRLNGAIVKLATQYQVDVPYNRMLVKMVHAIEEEYSA